MLESGGMLECGELTEGGYGVKLPTTKMKSFEAITRSNGFATMDDVRAKTVEVRFAQLDGCARCSRALSSECNTSATTAVRIVSTVSNVVEEARVGTIVDEQELHTLRTSRESTQAAIIAEQATLRLVAREYELEVKKVIMFVLFFIIFAAKSTHCTT